MKYSRIFYGAVLSAALLFSSCAKDENRITAFSDTMLEGESEVLQIPVLSAECSVACIYSTDGIPYHDQSGAPLSLSGYGQVDYRWFSLSRSSDKGYQLSVTDNLDGGTRGLVLELHLPDGTSEWVTVRQKESQGYSFVSMDYALEEGDGVSTVLSQTVDLPIESKDGMDGLVVRPLQGAQRSCCFSSNDASAFSWSGRSKAQMRIPTEVRSDYIEYGTELGTYTNSPIQTRVASDTLRVGVPSTTQSVHGTVVYQQTELTYYLTLQSRRTKAYKRIRGKWQQLVPVNYTLQVDSLDIR